jgi:hypothetical protein
MQGTANDSLRERKGTEARRHHAIHICAVLRTMSWKHAKTPTSRLEQPLDPLPPRSCMRGSGLIIRPSGRRYTGFAKETCGDDKRGYQHCCRWLVGVDHMARPLLSSFSVSTRVFLVNSVSHKTAERPPGRRTRATKATMDDVDWTQRALRRRLFFSVSAETERSFDHHHCTASWRRSWRRSCIRKT